MPACMEWPNLANMRLRVASYAGSGRAAAGAASPIGVLTNPGSTKLTLMANGRTSYQSDSEYPSSANLLADRKSTRLNSSHSQISYAVFCLKKKKQSYTFAVWHSSHVTH